MLTLARLFVAPEPSPAPADSRTLAPHATPDDSTPLMLIDFRPRARTLEASPPTHDLRDPFRPSTGQASTSTQQRASAQGPDLRDPFAEPATRPRSPAEPAEDLRDPFKQRAPAPRKCPDTGGVPIQRPDSVQAGCAQASRAVVVAQR